MSPAFPLAWSSVHQAMGWREGWDIVAEGALFMPDESDGQGGFRVQPARWYVQAVRHPRADPTPQPRPVSLARRESAWTIVARGHGEHHRAARQFLAEHDPAEFEAMAAWVGAHAPRQRHALEFPAFGPLDVRVPEGWEDRSDHREVCPCFVRGSLTLWIDARWPILSEIHGRYRRFVLERRTGGGHELLLQTDDWPEMARALRRARQAVWRMWPLFSD